MKINENNLEALPVVLTVMETANLLRVQRAKVYLLIDTGTLHGIKIGSAWRIMGSSVRQLLGIPEETIKSDSCIPSEEELED